MRCGWVRRDKVGLLDVGRARPNYRIRITSSKVSRPGCGWLGGPGSGGCTS